jgi:drug/metabolite transporter (DMT)-like permease
MFAVSTASIFIRMSISDSLAIASYRLIFSTLILLPFFLKNNGIKKVRSFSKKETMNLIAVGVILALHFASWITSLRYTSVASSVIFVHIDPIFVAAVSHFFLKERVMKKTLIGIIVAFFGVTIIAYGDADIGKTNLYGDFLALIGAIMLGLYILSGRRIRQKLDLVTYVTPVYATSAIVLSISSILTGTNMISLPLREYLLFFIMALIPMIFGHTIYNWALRYVEAPVVSLSLLGEPVGASILAYFILGEFPSKLSLIGGLLTLLGIYLSVRGKQ